MFLITLLELDKYLDRTNAALVMIIFCIGAVWLLSAVIHNTRDKIDELTDILQQKGIIKKDKDGNINLG